MFELLLLISGLGLPIVSLYAYEKYKWNDGICKKTGESWRPYKGLETGNMRWYESHNCAETCMTFISFTSLDGR